MKVRDTSGATLLKIGGGAGLGALIGAIAGGGKGALIGGLVGAGAGTGVALQREDTPQNLMRRVSTRYAPERGSAEVETDSGVNRESR